MNESSSGIDEGMAGLNNDVERVVKLHLTQRRKRSLLINDTYPGIVNVLVGIGMLKAGHFTPLAFASIIVGTTLVALGVKEWRSEPGEASHGVNWFDVSAGVLTILDAVAIYKPWKGFQPAWLYFLAGLVIISKGVFAPKVPGRRRMTITREGLKIRTSPFSALKIVWNDVASLEVIDKRVQITTKENNQKGISLRGVANSDEVIEVLLESVRKRGISTAAQPHAIQNS